MTRLKVRTLLSLHVLSLPHYHMFLRKITHEDPLRERAAALKTLTLHSLKGTP